MTPVEHVLDSMKEVDRLIRQMHDLDKELAVELARRVPLAVRR